MTTLGKSTTTGEADQLDLMLDQWRVERPELDLSGMALIPRLFRLAHLYHREFDRLHGSFGLKAGWLDVLSSLRRMGPPYRLPATELARTVLLSSGGMTTRIDRMEEARLVRRVPDRSDRRSVLVELTAAGRKRIDAAIDAQLELSNRLLRPLREPERAIFVELMRKQTVALERGGDTKLAPAQARSRASSTSSRTP